MARFFFDVIKGHGLERDETGTELDDADAIRKQVSQILTDITRDELPSEKTTHIQINVRDEAGQDIYNGELFFRGGWSQQA